MFYYRSYNLNLTSFKKIHGDIERNSFDVGDFTLNRNIYQSASKYSTFGVFDNIIYKGEQRYSVRYTPDEAKALKEHFERNRQYYNDEYGFIIMDICYAELLNEFSLKVFFPDWDKTEKEAEAKEKAKAKEQKRIESINW